MTAHGELIQVRDLYKSFPAGDSEIEVLKGISFKIKCGEFVAVMGQSGSGKSTLLYNISGMDRMTAGEVRLGEIRLRDLDESELADLRLKKMGFVFQENYLLSNLTILDNILLPGLTAKRGSYREVRKYGRELMEKTGILSLADRSVTEVSGGQLQRAGICRALVNRPKVLFADEPTGALNSKASEEVMDIFNGLNREGMTVVMVTHDPKSASRTDRVIYLKDGRVEDELSLGKYRGEDREHETLEWLIERGF